MLEWVSPPGLTLQEAAGWLDIPVKLCQDWSCQLALWTPLSSYLKQQLQPWKQPDETQELLFYHIHYGKSLQFFRWLTKSQISDKLIILLKPIASWTKARLKVEHYFNTSLDISHKKVFCFFSQCSHCQSQFGYCWGDFLCNSALFLLLLHRYFDTAESSLQNFWLFYSSCTSSVLCWLTAPMCHTIWILSPLYISKQTFD